MEENEENIEEEKTATECENETESEPPIPKNENFLPDVQKSPKNGLFL